MLACIQCKGNNPKRFCGRSYCPIIAKSEARFKVERKIKDSFFGSSPSPFVGRFGYPNVNVGVLSVEERDSSEHDAPRFWAEHDYKIPKIVDLRSSLVNSQFMVNVRGSHRFLDISQEVGMASKPVEMELKLQRAPTFSWKSDALTAPMGPNAAIKNVEITSNPQIDSRVEKVVDDSDLRATSALSYLYKHNFDENFLTRLLSVGNLGVKTQRRLVPTRWSITAVDDTLGKQLISQIKDYAVGEYCAYFGSYLGNYYLVMLFPEVWSYELFEMYLPKASWNISNELQFSTDYEGYSGRKDYAENCAGGYYAARLPILERLAAVRRQASVLTLRFITGDYYVPLGVWVVREATRKAMAGNPLTFESKELMLEYAIKLVLKKFGCDIGNLLGSSLLLREMKQQSKLSSFF
ncbi:MAG: Nre family DNA repair protein [Candidatus Woesearchaeota archaeon]